MSSKLFRKGIQLVGQELPLDLKVPALYEKSIQIEKATKKLCIEGLTLQDFLQHQDKDILILTTQDILKLVQAVVTAWFDLFSDNWYFETLQLNEIWVTTDCQVYFAGTPNRTLGIIQKGFHQVMLTFIYQLQNYFERKNTNPEVSSAFNALKTALPKIKYHWQLQRFNFMIKQYEKKQEITHSIGPVDRTDSLRSSQQSQKIQQRSQAPIIDQTESVATQFILGKIAQIEEQVSQMQNREDKIMVSEVEKLQLINNWVQIVKSELSSDPNVLSKLDAVYGQYGLQNQIEALVLPKLRNSIHQP